LGRVGNGGQRLIHCPKLLMVTAIVWRGRGGGIRFSKCYTWRRRWGCSDLWRSLHRLRLLAVTIL